MPYLLRLERECVQHIIDRIRRYGWRQGPGHTRQGPACIIEHAFVVFGRRDVARKKLLVDAFLAEVNLHPVFWNDEPGRTKEEVIVVLEKIRNKLR